MKLFKIIFILLIATTDISICLKTNELCRSNLKTCPVSFSHYCVQDYCAINKLACIDFQDLNKHMKLCTYIFDSNLHVKNWFILWFNAILF